MLRFRAASFAVAIGALHRAYAAIHMNEWHGVSPDPAADRNFVANMLDEADVSLRELPLSPVVVHQFERLKRHVPNADSSELVILIRELLNNITADLCAPFLTDPRQQKVPLRWKPWASV